MTSAFQKLHELYQADFIEPKPDEQLIAAPERPAPSPRRRQQAEPPAKAPVARRRRD